MPATPPLPLGALVAGGASRRFGRPKARAEVGGRPMAARVAAALAAAGAEVVVVGGDAALAEALGLPLVPDAADGRGPLGGVLAALRRAEAEGRPGALCLACDLPFVPPALLRRLLREGMATGASAVLPVSPGRHGVEPLCAWYAASARGEAEALLEEGGARLLDLAARLRARRLPLAEVRRHGDPDVLFLNVNTPADHARAEQIARGGAGSDSGG